jgi:tRNA pseudouridine38-40 synthase
VVTPSSLNAIGVQAGAMPRYALRIAYVGTAFHGWWRQPGQRTVADALDQAFQRLGETTAAPVGAARTDAGVHAHGQVAHVDCTREWLPARLLGVLNGHLDEDCAVTGVAAVDADWHAAHATTGKTYRYTIDDRSVPDPFLAGRCWRTPFALDLAAVQAAAATIPGHRDWSGFSRRGEHRDDLARRITACTWEREQGVLVATVTGDGFTYHLVRSLIGACVAVAHGTCTLRDLCASLAGETTPAGTQQAPASGLCLEHVRYPEEPAWVTA